MILDAKVIICAGGDGGVASNSRWQNYLGISRHMIPAKGEPLIHRTQRQLLEVGFKNIYLSCSPENKKNYLLDKINYFPSPKFTGSLYERCNTWHYRNHLNYNGVTVILYGDVYYTDEIIQAISKDSGKIIHWYGRRDRSKITQNQRQGEWFAVCIPHNWIEKYLRAIKKTAIDLPYYIENKSAIPEDLSKYSYRNFCRIPYEAPGNTTESVHWVEWDDLTDDFDYPEDWESKSKLFPDIFYA